jgi:hypothetical protein
MQGQSYSFLKNELERIESVLKGGALEDTQSDQFMIRRNILSRLVSIVESAGDIYVGRDEQ